MLNFTQLENSDDEDDDPAPENQESSNDGLEQPVVQLSHLLSQLKAKNRKSAIVESENLFDMGQLSDVDGTLIKILVSDRPNTEI